MATVLTILPGWSIAIGLFVLLWLGSSLGGWLRQRFGIDSETPQATAAAVSLLALLIGFTFSLSLNRYDARRDLLVEEAAAIESLWQRLPLVPAASAAEMTGLVRSYADQRLAYFTFGIDADTALRADRAADDVSQQMWAIVRDLSRTSSQPLIPRMLMDNLARIDDAAWRREAMGREHVPLLVIDLLVVFAFFTAVSMGVAAPRHRRAHPTHVIFFALAASSIMLMLDLDRPRSGLVQVSQLPMQEIIAIMAAHSDDPDRAAAP